MNFELRPWRKTDLDNLVKYANNPKIANNLTNRFPHPYHRENGQEFIEFANAHTPQHIMAIVVNGEAVGGIGVHPQDDIFHKNAEMGYWLAESLWGNGIITAAIQKMVVYGFQNFDINRIFARPFGTNIGSQRALEKAGFELEARFEQTLFKNGVYYDELVYAVRK